MNIRITSALAVAVFATVSLAGCGAIQDRVDDAVGNAVEEGVERAIEGGSGGDVDINLDGSGASLPENFPSDVPQPTGPIQASIGSADGFVVSFTASEAEAEAFLDQFSGWEADDVADLGEMKAYGFTNDTYRASVGVVAGDAGVSVTYTIAVSTS